MCKDGMRRGEFREARNFGREEGWSRKIKITKIGGKRGQNIGR